MKPSNDSNTEEIINLPPKDVGVTDILHPMSSTSLNQENIIVSVENFGGEPQSNFEVGYSLNGGEWVRETFTETLEVNSTIAYTFSQATDFSVQQGYAIEAATFLEDDSNPENDSSESLI